KASVTIANVGRAPGEVMVHIYIRDGAATVTRPVREWKGFQRITLQPGERRRVSFTLGPAELGFYNRELRFAVEPGAFQVFVGPNSVEGLEGSFEVGARCLDLLT